MGLALAPPSDLTMQRDRTRPAAGRLGRKPGPGRGKPRAPWARVGGQGANGLSGKCVVRARRAGCPLVFVLPRELNDAVSLLKKKK